MDNKLRGWLKEIKECALVTDGEINQQATGNLWSFGFSIEEMNTTQKHSLIDFVVNAEKIILNKWGGDGLFYCWLDDMSGRLRISSISRHFRKLPFLTDIEIVSEPSLIVELMLFRYRNMHNDIEGDSNNLKVYVGQFL